MNPLTTISLLGLIFGISVLPALLVMPVMAEDITETVTDSITGQDININIPGGAGYGVQPGNGISITIGDGKRQH